MELARRDLAKLWGTLQQLSPEWQRDMLLDYVPQLVAKYGDLAAQAAYEWYMRVRGESVPESWEYDLSDSFPGDGIDKTLRWQAGHLWTDPQTMQAFLVGAMMRWVIVKVLPEPAPATTNTSASTGASMMAACSALGVNVLMLASFRKSCRSGLHRQGRRSSYGRIRYGCLADGPR